ncbi:MAG: hypothetical protein U0401_20980 [Anaerolineae bacterium]
MNIIVTSIPIRFGGLVNLIINCFIQLSSRFGQQGAGHLSGPVGKEPGFNSGFNKIQVPPNIQLVPSGANRYTHRIKTPQLVSIFDQLIIERQSFPARVVPVNNKLNLGDFVSRVIQTGQNFPGDSGPLYFVPARHIKSGIFVGSANQGLHLQVIKIRE